MEDLIAAELAHRLFAGYPATRPPELATPSLYAEYISRETEEVGRVAVERMFEAYPHRVPHLGELIGMLRATRQEMTPHAVELYEAPASAEEAAAILAQYRRRPVDLEATAVEDAAG